MRQSISLFLTVICIAYIARAGANDPDLKTAHLFIHASDSSDQSQPLRLNGADDKRQLLVTANLPSGDLRDFTHSVTWSASPDGIITIDKTGRVSPAGDGSAVISAKS